MKNKINLNLYVQTLKQLVIPAVIIGSVCIVASMLNMLNPDVNMPVYNTVRLVGHYFSKFYNGRPIAAAVAPSLIVFMYVGSSVFTYVSFKHLNSRSSSDFYHSLPYTRTSGFISRILAVFTLQYGIILITMGVSVLTMMGSGISFDASFIPKLILSYMAGSTLVAGGLALAMSLTGNLIANAMMALVILVLPRTLLFIAGRMITHANYYGFINISTMGIFLNPVNNIPIASIMDITRIWEFYGLSETLINIKAAVYTYVLGIVYLGLALLAMRKRKSELAGNGVRTNIMLHLLCALASLPFLVYGFHSVIRYGVFNLEISANVQQFAVFAAIGLVVFLTSEFILNRHIKSAFKSLPVLLLAGVLAFGLIFAQKELAVKINNKVPAPENIEYVKIDNNYAVTDKYKPLYSYSNLLTKDIEFSEPELVSIVRGNLERMTQAYDARRGDQNANLDRYRQIYCEFRLKNGRSVFRSVYLYEDTLDDLWELISVTPDYKKLSVALPPVEKVDDIGIYKNLIMDEAYKEEFYALFKDEFEGLATVTKNSIMNENHASLYWSFHDSLYYVPYTNISNFNVYGNSGGYTFISNYDIGSRTPESAKFYMQKINSAAHKQFFSDVEKLMDIRGSEAGYRINFEITNFDRDGSSPYQGFVFGYDGMHVDGYYIDQQKISEMLGLIEKKDLNDIGFSSPIAVISIYKQDVDPEYTINYHVYAQLDMEEAEELFETYIELYE